MHRSTKAAVAAALFSLVLPVASQAATKAVSAGPPFKKPPAGVPMDADINKFFPTTIKVHAGDSVKFQNYGFHTFNFPKKGGGSPPLAVPDATHPAGGADAAGAPFWFTGQGTPVIPAIVGTGTPSGKAYTGAAAVGSGLPNPTAPPKPFVVKFPKAGTFTYFCAVHPGMKASVTVVPKTKAVPSAAADQARAKAQLAKDIATVKKLDKARGPSTPNTVLAGPDTTSGPVLLRFTPSSLTTTIGTPVSLEMMPGTTEAHTFTFAKDVKAAGKLADQTFVAPLAGTGSSGPPTFAFDPKYAYPSEAPTTPVTYDGTNHGDGFLNSGILDGDPRSPFPQKFTVSFSQPGTYTYFCAIHTFMNGTVVVQ